MQDEKKDMEMLEAKVDPAEWKLELERVGPKLRFKVTHPTNSNNSRCYAYAISAIIPRLNVYTT
jgi:hypothetical protein